MAIGVFDSGVGGLTVLRKLAEHFPFESFLYLGDNAHLPYGTKSPEIIRRYSEQALSYLASKQVKALVVACNSASSVVHESSFAGLPVETVIAPGAEFALATSVARTGRIGVLGTRATINSGLYEKYLYDLAMRQGHQVAVFSAAAPLFVPLAEEGWTDDPVTNIIVYRYLSPLLAKNIDTLVMGCTHYPILREAIARVCGNSVALIDSGEAVAFRLRKQMQENKIQAESSGAGARTLKLLMTDPDSNFVAMANSLLSPLKVDGLEVVHL